MASEIRKIELGPAIVEYGEGGGKVLFETTIGGVSLAVETKYRDQKIDQTGETVRTKRIIGRDVKVEIPFAEYELEVIPKVMVGSEIVTAKNGNKKVIVKTGVGMDLLAQAKKVVIKPTVAKTDASKWVTLPLAYPTTDLQFNYDSENERITKVVLHAAPDATDILLILGDVEVKAGV